MQHRFTSSIVALCALLTVESVPAHADITRVALESYVGQRPNDADRVMTTLRKVLKANGFAYDPKDLSERFAQHAWRSGGNASAGPQMSAAIDRGRNSFENSDWKQALDALGPAVASARANPIAWEREPKYREQVREGMLYLALANAKQASLEQDQAGAAANPKERASHEKLAGEYAAHRDAAMGDLIRLFPSFVATRTHDGLEAEQLYQRVRQEIENPGRGFIDIKVDDPDAVIYLDSEIQRPQVLVPDQLVGTHQVLVITKHDVHLYSVEVLSHQTSRLQVRSEFDRALVVSKDWVGFRYESQKQRDDEPRLVADLVQLDTSAVFAVVFNVTHVGGVLSVTGTTYSAKEPRNVRTCDAKMASYDDDAAMVKLVRCLTAFANSSASVASPSPSR
jgi:hypothetical protein